MRHESREGVEDRANQSSAKAVNREAGDEPGRDGEQNGVDDQDEQTERQKGQGKRQDDEDRSKKGIQKPDDHRGPESREKPDVYAGHQLGDDHQCDRAQHPAKDEIQHGSSSHGGEAPRRRRRGRDWGTSLSRLLSE